MNDKITIAVVTDFNYIKYLKPFLISVNKNFPSACVYILAVNISVEEALKFYSWHDNIKVVHDLTFLDDTKWYSRRKDSLDSVFLKEIDYKKAKMVNQKICYCNNIRFQMILDMLNDGYDNILFMDVDMIIRKDLNHLIEMTKDFDIAMQPYLVYNDDKTTVLDKRDIGDREVYKLYCVEFLFIKNNNITKKFFKECVNEINNVLGLYTWGHAESFGAAVRRVPEMKIYELEHSYKDESYNDESPVWSGEDFRKYEKHETYSNEMYCEKYVNEMIKYGYKCSK